ncbi:mercury transporter MerT [Candidatus Kaiserbacteria bacterium]|nr:mercury transporter MerT [Candidatus Kaiserbacteria bacterium]
MIVKTLVEARCKLSEEPIHSQPDTGRFAAIAGVVGALLASSCCVVPLVLVTLGASGAWIGNLSALDPYKNYFALVTLAFLGAGYWQVYFKKSIACDDGSSCVYPASRRVTKTALWIATVLVVSALTIDWWAPLFY